MMPRRLKLEKGVKQVEGGLEKPKVAFSIMESEKAITSSLEFG